MAVPSRVRGNAAFFSMKKGASAAVAFDDLKSYELTSEPKDDSDLTFYEAGLGLSDWTFSGTAVYSLDAGSLYQYLWTNVGSDVVVQLNPKGAVTPSVGSPAYTGTFRIVVKPGVSNEASSSTTTSAEFDFELTGLTDVTQITV